MIQTFLTEAKTTRILLFVDQMDEFEWNYNALSCTKKKRTNFENLLPGKTLAAS